MTPYDVSDPGMSVDTSGGIQPYIGIFALGLALFAFLVNYNSYRKRR